MAATTHIRNPLLLRPTISVVPPKIMVATVGSRRLMICRCTVDSKSVAGGDVFSVTSSSKSDFDYLGQSTKGDLNLRYEIDTQPALEGPIEEVARMEAEEAETLLKDLGIPVLSPIYFSMFFRPFLLYLS